MGQIGNYFHLHAGITRAEGGPPGWVNDLPQYLALLAGIFIQPFLASYRATGHWNFTGWVGWLFFAAIVGLAIFPAVYKGAFDPTKGILAQLCAIFAAGLGWQSLFQTAVKAVGGQ